MTVSPLENGELECSLEATSSQYDVVRVKAVRTLTPHISDERVYTRLIEMADDSCSDVRWAVFIALGSLKEKRADQAILDMGIHDPAIHRWLGEMQIN